ncbi:MAG: aminotransferase class V-fold PLP-dependent enzyme [Cyclobacteriaceae bacterium]|nr:aminotransferase class V-fold PLP-dependent enzyme [Cyclobacteriaceae bacterium]
MTNKTPLKNQRRAFTLPSGKTFLNCAYLSPLPKEVEKAGINGILAKQNPFQISQRDFFQTADEVRIAFSETIGNADPHRVVIIPSVSYGLANVARNIKLRKGEEVLVAEAQFPSNIYPWKRLVQEQGGILKTVKAPATHHSRGKLWNEQILDAISYKTRVVALGHVHWTDGTLFDLKAIRQKADQTGALLIIDGTQSVGALPFDVNEIRPDALICAGYKWLLGPYGIGVAYYGQAFDNGTPIEENWINRKNSEDFTGLVNYQDNYQPGALRYEVGEHSNFILLPMLLAALRLVNRWSPASIQEYCHKINVRPLAELQQHGWWVEEESFRAQHLFGIRPPQGVSLQAARQLIQAAGISVSFRGDAIRVAPHVYNSEKELFHLVRLLIQSSGS